MAALAGLPPNGNLSTPSDRSINEIEEYEKILRIRDQVFAGSHPRLTVPAHALRKVSPKLPEVPPVSIHSHVESLPSAIDHSSVRLPGLQTNNPVTEQTTPNSVVIPNGTKSLPQSHTPQPTASGIDPIFLTKSDELVRQEMIFQRSRLEKQLREQFEKKKSEARSRPHPEEVKPERNISNLLIEVMDFVKPLASTKTPSRPDRASPSDSFDENSFYSSRAPDSTPEEGALSEHSLPAKHQVQPRNLDNLDADGPVDQRVLQGQQPEKKHSPRQPISRPTRTVQSNIPFPYDLRQDRGMLLGVDTVDLTSMDVDEDDEPEYSPPEPTEQYPLHNNEQISRLDYRDPRNRPLRRYSGADQHDKRPGSPLEADMRINPRSQHDPNYQNRRHYDAAQQSPEHPQTSENARKKRKLDKKANRLKKRKGNTAGSPETHIKDEPVSPPPFHDVQPLGAHKTRSGLSNVPIYIDDEPAEHVRYAPAQDRFAQSTPRHVVYDEHSLPRTDPPPFSRASARPLLREDQDLRRVASLQNMRAEQPGDYIDTSFHTPTRATSHSYTVIEDPSGTPSMSRREPIYLDDRHALRQSRAIGSPAPVYRMDPNADVRYRDPEMLPPQQKRVIQDQYGNQYEFISRHTAAPRQSIDLESYSDMPQPRDGRASSVFTESARERRYMQEMPPPQITYRRVEGPRTPLVDSRQMADLSRSQRSASVQMFDYPSKQSVRGDDNISVRPAVRMSSVRPREQRYEEVRVPVGRVESVHPVEREGSVFMEERRQRREYVPIQAEKQPMYRRIIQDGQYYEIQEPRYER